MKIKVDMYNEEYSLVICMENVKENNIEKEVKECIQIFKNRYGFGVETHVDLTITND